MKKHRYQFRLGGIVYVAVALFIGLAALNSQTNLLFWTFGLMLGGLIVSGVVSGMMLLAVDVERLLPDHGVVGEPLIIRYRFRNKKWWLPVFGLVVRELDAADAARMTGIPHGLVLHMGPRAQVQAEAIGWPVRRGRLTMDRIDVGTTFPFGIIRKSVTFAQPTELLIYPRLYRLRRELLVNLRAAQLSGDQRSQSSGGEEEFYGLREYRYGDSIRHIDWKRSAHAGKLLCREMTKPRPPQLMVLLDLRDRGQSPHSQAEDAIALASSVIYALTAEAVDTGLVAEGAACPTFEPRHSWWHRTQVLHALAEVDLDGPTTNPNIRTVKDAGSWLVIHAGPVDRSFGPEGAVHMTSQATHQYLNENEPEAAPGPVGTLIRNDHRPRYAEREEAAWA